MRKLILAAVAVFGLVGGAAVGQSGFVGADVTDKDGMMVGTVTDVMMSEASALTITGVVIKTETSSFVAPPAKLSFDAAGELVLDATSEEIAAMPQFGGDSAESSKGDAGGQSN
jgi:sporulation protein YlmC with PRC-barrel domain